MSTNVYRIDPLEAVSSITPDQANRDGDFIRYITSKLKESTADIRYFFLISDGMPCSDNYQGKEALDDTVIAMREAVTAGIRLVYLNIDTNQAEYFSLFKKEAHYAEHFSRPEEILPRIPNLVEAVMKAIS
jgi:nitric oxide reductase activation protein